MVAVEDPRLRIDPSGRRLWRDGQRLRVRRKVFDLLALFVANEGRLLTRDEILAEVWSGRHLSEGVLRGCVRDLRRALGDDARRPRHVEAVPGHGYRFLGGVGTQAVVMGRAAPRPGVPPPTVVVLPLAGPRGNLGALAELATAEVATALARHECLRLVPATGAVGNDGCPTAARAVGRRLGASHLVIGALHPAGRGARLHLRLLSAEAGLCLWADGIALRRPLDGAARGAADRAAREIAARLRSTG